jgi:3-hydroxyisobutyrate dehydrogenase-like beta-hydroxyacid dehydrogenase
MAGRLLSAGYVVYGTNRTKSRADALLQRGMVWADSPRAAAERSDVVFSMVTDTAALRAITQGPDGLLAGLRPGSVYIDMSTVGPAASRELADQVAERGALMLDAPVSGSLPAAQDGSLTIMVGGDADAFTRIEPLLRTLGRTVTRVGDNGQALTMKLAVNISLAAQIIAFSEGVLLAERGGIDPELAIDVLTSSAIGSPMLAARGPLVLHRPATAWFDVRLMQKDISLTLEQGRQLQIPLPSAALADEMLTAARGLGYGDQDIVGMFDVLAVHAGGHPVAA